MSERPDWDEYFLSIAQAVAARADCTRRQVGAVIVRQQRIVATGYNGAPAGMPGCLSGACPRGHHRQITFDNGSWCACGHPWPCPDYHAPGSGYNTPAGYCIAIHAEANAILYAGRERCLAAILYITHHPCDGCAKLIWAAGIARIICPDGEWTGR